jgi:hypothetical protein
MRPTSALTFLLIPLLANHPASAQQRRDGAAALPRTWSVEMRDKAEASLYRKHDCTAALTQANAGFERALRHQERMDPRLPLVKARAHQCLGQLPEAILNFTMHDRLSAMPSAEDIELAGACHDLVPGGRPAEATTLARLTDSLTAVRAQLERAMAANATELRLRLGVSMDAGSGGYRSPVPVSGEVDQGSITRDMGNETLRVMRAAWFAPPADSRVTGYNRRALDRADAAGQQLAGLLADVEARLLCLNLEQ